MTKLMKNLYNLGSKTIRQSIISIRHHAENGMMHNSLCRLVAVLLLSVGAFSYAQAGTVEHDGVIYDLWDGTYSTTIINAGIEGGGTVISPYLIDTGHKLATIMYLCSNNGNWSNKKYFKLTGNIDLNGDVHEWEWGSAKNGNNFRGVFDGAGHTIINMKIVARESNETGGWTGRYGLFPGLNGVWENSKAYLCEVKNLNIKDAKLIIESANAKGDSKAERFYGIIAGRVTSYSEISNIKVINPEIIVKCSQTAKWDIGAIASLNGWAHAKNIVVTSPRYKSESAGTLTFTVGTNNQNLTRLSVGGVVGYISDDTRGMSTSPLHDGGTWSQANYINDCAVTDADFDFHHFVPSVADSYQYANFSVAGVVGNHWYPFRMCENLFFSGKIKAPGAYVVPCVFIGMNMDWKRIVCSFDYEKASDADRVEKSRSATWYYNNYKIGLSSDFTDAVLTNGYFGTKTDTLENADLRYLNFAKSSVDVNNYVTVNPFTLKRQNRLSSVARPSRTLLWWTNSDHNGNGYQQSFNSRKPYKAWDTSKESDWRDGYQDIYPQADKALGQSGLTAYPDYYMYYAQGVNMGTKYVTDDAADKFVAGLTKNIEVAQGVALKKVTLSISETAPQDGSLNGAATEVNQNYKEAVRGFVSHNFTITPDGANAGDISSYKWYVDGAEDNSSTSASLNGVKPSFVINQGWQTAKPINVVALDAGGNVLAQASTYIPLLRLRTSNQEELVANPKSLAACINFIHNKIPGSQNYPFLIGCEEELRLMQEQMCYDHETAHEGFFLDRYKNNSTDRTCLRSQNNTDINWPGYGQAYYRLDNNITLSPDVFYPIGANSVPVNGDFYSWNRAFIGEFDGRGYTISGLRQEWFSADGNGPTALWGLFSVIGHGDPHIRCGGTEKTSAAVRNLKLDDVILKHKKSNLSFYNNNGNGYWDGNTWRNGIFAASPFYGWASQCYVGTLAGVAGAYAIIENVSVTNAQINDDDSQAYDLASKRFSIGGLIGRAQKEYGSDNSAINNAKIRYVSADTDIKITHAKYHNTSNQWDQRAFLIGGIIGSMYSNSTENTLNWAAPAIFTGKIQAPNAMAGPIYGLMSWNGNAGGNWQDLVKQFTGKTSTTMQRDATGMYYNYQHYNGTQYKDVNDTYPPVTSNYGDRNIKEKADHPTGGTNMASTSNYGGNSGDGDLYEYQGVNLGNYAVAESAEVLEVFNDKTQVRGTALSSEESAPINDYQWIWSTNTVGRDVLVLGAGGTVEVTAKDTYNAKDETPTHKLVADVNTSATGTPIYQWYQRVRVNGVDTEKLVDGANQREYTPTQNVHNQYFFVKVTVPGIATPGTSEDVLVPASPEITASISKDGGAGSRILSVSLTPAVSSPDYSVSYQWYKGKVDEGASYKIPEATSASYGVPSSDEATLHYCVVTVVDETAPRSPAPKHDYLEDNTFTFTLVQLPADETVVFLDPESGNDSNDGSDPKKAVKSWHKAYSLLMPDVTWNDNVIVLMSNSTQDRTKEGFYCSNNAQNTWDIWYAKYHGDNTTTLDGNNGRQLHCTNDSKPNYDDWYNGDMWKNVTITGKYKGNDYSDKAQITMCGGGENNMCIYGDTRFEHLTFYGDGNGSNGGNYDILYCFYNSLEMGDGLVMKHFRRANDAFGRIGNADNCDFQIFGGPLNDARFKDPDYGGFNNELMEEKLPHGSEGFEINIKSGFFSVICSSYRQNNTNGAGIVGSPDMPIRCTMNIDIDQAWNKAHSYAYHTDGTQTADKWNYPMTYDIGMLLAGNHEGAMYGDVDINVYSGRVGRISSGNLGAIRDFSVSGSHYIPLNSFMGRAGIVLDPAKSRLKGEDGFATDDDRITVTEVYGGGLGRNHGSDGMVNIPFYGHNRITINGGKFEVLYRANTSYPSEVSVTPGVFATGAGGVNGIYHVDEQQRGLVPVFLTYNNDGGDNSYWPSIIREETVDGVTTYYAKDYEDKEYYFKKGDLVRYNDEECTQIKGNGAYRKRMTFTESYDLSVQRLPYWGEAEGHRYVAYGPWQTYKTKTGADKVIIKCYDPELKQEVDIDPEDTETILTINGGVFGSAEHKIYGIFGGGSGFVSTDILGNSATYPNFRGGNIYGKEGSTHPVAQLNINGGEFYCTDGIFAGGRGTDYYYKTRRHGHTDTSSEGAYYGHYTSLGQIYGDIEMNITGGIFHCDVFGGGKGFGTIKYNNNLNTLKTLKDMARVYGTTTVNISGGTFDGNIYGGGAIANVGSGYSSEDFKDRKSGKEGAWGADNRDLTVAGKSYFSIGAKNAITVNISGGVIKGKVFGAAQGLYEGETICDRSGNVDYYTTYQTQIPDSVGNVFGNVALNITGGTIYGKKAEETDGGVIYGGAEKGDVYGNVTANISGAGIGGDIFGGGLGYLAGSPATIKASADVTGNASVTLGKGTTYVKLSEGNYVADSETSHYIYGGGNLASVIGQYKDANGDPTKVISAIKSAASGGNTTLNINNGMGVEQLTVYGAGLGANTYCNMTNVNINDFAIEHKVEDVSYDDIGLREVYGGGNEGTVFTNTTVNMNGGQVLGTVFGGGNLAAVGTLITAENLANHEYGAFGSMVSLANPKAVIWGDIFGGGNQADVSGISQVSVSQGAFAGQIFGGGKGVMTNDNTVATPANIHGQTFVYVNGANVQWNKKWISRFDDSAVAADKGKFKEWTGAVSGTNSDFFIDKTLDGSGKKVTAVQFRNPHNIFGGGCLASVVSDTARVEVTNGAVPAALIKLSVWKMSFSDDANPHFYVFGGGYGPFTQVKATDVTVGVEGYYSDDEDESTNEQWSLDVSLEEENQVTEAATDDNMTIYGNNYGIGGYTVLGVIGGGYAGLVKEDTNVKLGGTTFVHRVYGGGYGHLGEYNKLLSSTNIATGITGNIIPTDRYRENLGEVGRNTYVRVSLSKPDEKGRTGGVYGDVFGGGAGVESADPADETPYKDFVDMGKVLGFTRVSVVENARVYGSVYGGGDVANVANSITQDKPYKAYGTVPTDSATIVRIEGGNIFGDVFGGGKGRVKSKANDYTTLGNIAGNTFVFTDTSTGIDSDTEEEITYTPNIWGNIYGGGQIGDVNASGLNSTVPGNANILVNGGNIGNNIYGAGEGKLDGETIEASADVTGNTNVTVNGGSFLWRQIAGIGGSIHSMTDRGVTKEAALAIIEAKNNGETAPELAALKSDISDVFDVDKKLFVNDHNIYGGGNTVSIVGGYRDKENGVNATAGEHSASIIVNHGMMTEALGYYDNEEWSTGALLYHLISTNNSHPQFSVLGGGYGANTTITGNTNVTVSIGKEDAYDGATDGGATRTADRAVWSALLNTSDGTYKTEFDALTTEIKQRYYGGESGMLSGYVTSRLANNFSIPNHTFMNIVGGGMAGKVTGNAAVSISDQSMCHNVFGGGIGIMPASPTGTETYGQVGGATTVNITGGIIENNVYGGGAGVESYKDNDGNYTDFTEIAAVDKTTSVSITGTSLMDDTDGTVIFGKVFGGGDVANVKNSAPLNPADPAATVSVTGGAIYQQVFGGGSGRLNSQCNNYTALGKVYGNTHVTINQAVAKKPTYLWNRVYGGGSYGSVTGNTTVDILGGNLGYNIFGGGFGDDGSTLGADIADEKRITSSDVGGDTNVNINGGEWCLWFMWDADNRSWVPASLKSAGVYYTSQYDPETNKFRINHNIYGGGNAACKVTGDTYVTMTKGMLYSDTPIGRSVDTDTWRSSVNLFDQDEWKNIYNKVGSFHFSVIGGGYGKKTSVNNTHVHVNIDADAHITNSDVATGSNIATDNTLKDLWTIYKTQQSVLDVIGGGYNGVVENSTNVIIEGRPFMRRAYGGSFYNDVQTTSMLIRSASVDDVFAGGMMGDVKGAAILNIGETSANNDEIFINHDVYGGNDVSGQIGGQISVNIYGGKIFHNVYGAGNGNYLYALNEGRKEVTAVEDYEIDGATYPLVYEVPRREVLMPASASSASEAARLVNINSYRPLSQFIELKVAGRSAAYPVRVVGNIFGGGNTATVTKLDGTRDPQVTVDLGDYVTASQVFMGADGEAMFDESTNGTLNAFKRINNIELSDGINWVDDPYNKAIPVTYLPLSEGDRQKTFPHIIDLYFQPVQMSVQPILKWNGAVATPNADRTWTQTGARDVVGTTFGSFFCGGNRGNMDVTPADDGRVVNYIFPAGLTIKDKIVGGCNNANFVRNDLGVVHEGGYLLGSRGTEKPMIDMLVKCNIDVASSLKEGVYTSGNIYGGCYKSGTINGDISIDVQTNMVNGLEVQKIIDTNVAGKPAGNIYGGGYGTESYVYGNINVAFGTSSEPCTQGTSGGGSSLDVSLDGAGGGKVTDVTPVTINDTGFSANNIYGGGEFGNVIGNTTVKVLNGHVTGNVSGGAYAGVQYGSTQVLVGYPEYYTVNKSGIYAMLRADKKNLGITNETDKSNAIKQVIRLVKGDIIAPTVYDAIVAKESTESSNFTPGSVTASGAWGNVKINIGDAVYGGGYSLASTFTGSGGAGTNTVRKFNDKYNINNTIAEENDYLHTRSTIGWGGNTTVLIWDNTAYDAEHIDIATNETTDGGMFGDGHLSYSEGFRAGELRGYGYASHSVLSAEPMPISENGQIIGYAEQNHAKLLNTIQRFDQMRLTDNCVLLNGARDYTIKEITTTPYSIARVGELQMVSSIATETLPTDPTATKYRNYVGLNNNIHYVGAVKSNVAFDDVYHNANGNLDSDNASITYKQKKQQYINDFYATYPKGKNTELQDEAFSNAQNKFNLRNDATSKNMIGLSSGYAMKVQGTYDKDAVGTEGIYYGPVDGVIEMKLIQPILDEGGGYVYADNVHEDKTNFLESTGNFVFPSGLGKGQYVVDDCLLTNYDDITGSPKDAESSEMHYWFLIGNHYFYNLHITGFTYDSASEAKLFNADTSDGLTILEGANPEQLYITGIKWNGHHKDDAKTVADATYNTNCDIQNGDKDYTLRLSISKVTDDNGIVTEYNYNETADKSMFADISRTTDLDNGTLKPYGEGSLPDGYKTQSLSHNGDLPTAEMFKSPILSLQLRDAVNNSTGNSEGLTAAGYYDKHLSKPDTVQIELRSKPLAWKTYTINLIINYVKGPTHSGDISLANCALPGEYIRINKGVSIDADESFAQNGEYFRIGKVNSAGDGLENGYYTFDTSGEKTSEVLKDKVYVDAEGRYVMIPAYYFMNGYGVQYVYTCNNMSDNTGNPILFPVALNSANKLLVHNYHQMKPDSSFPVELRLQEALARAKKDDTFAEPRIYIRNVADMQAFQQFVDTVGVDYPTVNLPGYMDSEDSSKPEEIEVPKSGKFGQFFLQNNIEVQQTSSMADKYYKAPAEFEGTFNGDGYTVKGIDNNFITKLTGNVYNLGLTTGSIAATKEGEGKIHTSFEYGKLNVYDMDGASKIYTEEEFHNGTVAYNLNQYYLEARKKMLEASSTTQAELAEVEALAYVKNYYANGDYQYARQYNATTGKEYLRKDVNPHYAAEVSSGYDDYKTYHNTDHTVDAARKIDVSTPNSLWTAMSEAETANSQMALDISLADKVATAVAPGDAKYKPLFNAAKIDAASGETVVKNDYIFFGQGLQAVPEDYPSAIVSHDVDDMTNRVWRASGFYRTKVDRGFHFNASSNHEVITYVHDPRTTAIDFTGKRDEENNESIPSDGLLEESNQKIYYAPTLDLPTAGYHHLEIDEDVTKNLLIYTGSDVSEAHSIAKLTKDATSADGRVVNYGDATAENKILAHQITGTPATSYTAAKLHLVDREDFNAPIQFTATKAWYERIPETGYVEQAGKAWSSVALPYDVQTATLSDGITRYTDSSGNGVPSVGSATAPQKEISFFYGSDSEATADKAHTILNHEFWLRSLNEVKSVSGEKRAVFKRPERSIDGKLNGDDASPTTSGFAAYKPFIVSFPGEQFYEFDMTGQSITFGATSANIAVTDDATTYDERNSYKHYAAFLNNEGTGVYTIDVNGEGSKFEAGKTVYPFRSYLTTGSALAPNSMDVDFADGYILISDDLGKLEKVLDGDMQRDPDGGVSTPSGLHVYGVGQRLVVVSDFATTLPVYTATGALVRVLDVRPGTATYSGFKQGIYVVDHKKIRLR